MWRRVRSVNIAASESVDSLAVALVRLLTKEAADTNDGCRADAGALVDLAVRHLARIEQPGNVPALGHGPDFRRRTQVDQQPAHFLSALGRQQSVAQVVGQNFDVAR